MKKLLLTTAFLGGSMLAAGAAQASITINSGNWGPCLGLASCVVDGVTISALGDAAAATGAGFGIVPGGVATMTQQIFASTSGLGINFAGYGGSTTNTDTGSNKEIQFSETLKFEFAGPVELAQLQLVFLYNPVAFNTDPQEIAIIGADPDGNAVVETLTVIDNTATGFVWTGGGTVTRDSISQGLWTFTNPFGSDKITMLTLTSALDNVGTTDGSDYSFRSLTTAAVSVPEPATLGLLGAGLLGLGFAARRRRAA